MHNGGTMSDTPISLQYQAPPRNGGALFASLFAGRPALAPDAQHGIRFDARWQGARADAARLAQYREVCALPDTGTLPLLYVHAMAMPLHMAILSHARFPLRLLGLVHWSNQLESLRPIANGEAVDEAALQAAGHAAMMRAVDNQIASGIDVGNNGEQQREGFFLYVQHRMSGFGGSWKRLSGWGRPAVMVLSRRCAQAFLRSSSMPAI